MKVLVICGVFAKENEEEVCAHSRQFVNYAANTFQSRLIHGFRELTSATEVISAPFIGSFPNASDIKFFSGFQKKQTMYSYVHFNNIWGIRNISRARSLKNALKGYIRSDTKEKLIVVYSPHTPFLEAAVYAKQMDPTVKICLVVPDLPEYMNLNSRISLMYKILKKVDIWRFNQLNRQVDSYVLLTDAMAKKINTQEKPYCVIEGIFDCEEDGANLNGEEHLLCNSDNLKYIVYTGKLNEKFGIKKLVDEFCELKNPSYRLVLCGRGDADEYVAQKSKLDDRIIVTGQISYEEAKSWMRRATVLVNPRENNEEYIKYSFPSKILEYLASGKPTVAFMLDGMPRIYRNFLFVADDNRLAESIDKAMNAAEEEKAKRIDAAKSYLQTLSGKNAADKIMRMCVSEVQSK